MEQRTVLAAFGDSSTAQSAVDELERFGLRRDQISVHANSSMDEGTTTPAKHEGGFTHWLKSLFGSEEETDYHRAYKSGNSVVAVNADDSQIDQIVDILDRYNPVDLQEKSASTAGDTTTSSSMASTPVAGTMAERNMAGSPRDEGSALPVVEEDLAVGKRQFQRGGVRVVSRVVERPVEESVQLRDEHVFVDRQPADRAANASDFNATGEQVIEVVEFAEEPVVEKRARVVEEVRVGKTANDRTETIRDTVRNTEVNVEQLGRESQPAQRTASVGSSVLGKGRPDAQVGATAAQAGSTNVGTMKPAGAYQEDFRRDFEQRYSSTGANYDAYGPAYEYGYGSASDPQFRNKSYADVEPVLRSNYEKRYPNSTWDKMKDSVRYGWDRVTGKT